MGNGHGVENTWINLTRPQFSRVLTAHLSKAAGGFEITKPKKGKNPPVFKDTADPTYAALLKTIQAGKKALEAKPRVDMFGAVPVPQERDFGRTF